MSMQRIVIVGNGIAGVTAADTLRAQGFDGEITLIGDEPHAAYSRPALSKALLRDPEDLASHELPPPVHGATEMRGVRAVGLDAEGKVVKTDGGEVAYDRLIIATGCRARRLPRESAEQLTLRTLDDAWQLRDHVAGKPSVIVVGGGPLGMEIASSCLDSGCDVVLVSQGPPLHLQLGEYLSGILTNTAQARGLRIVETVGARIGEGARVSLAEGQTVEADLVITAVGDVPNIEWLAHTGLLTDGALVTDAAGRLRPDIVAAGDVATVPTPNGYRRVPLWSAAIDQAKTAATALLTGELRPHDARPYFWTEQFGLSLKAVGTLPLVGEPEVVEAGPEPERMLLRWDGAAAAINYRIPIPRLRRLA